MVAEEAPLRLDGGVGWDGTTRWLYEPESFRPLAKLTAGGQLLPIANDHLGTPREMFKEAAEVAWAASYTSWGVVRAVRKPLASANDDGRAVYPRLREDDAAISPSPKIVLNSWACCRTRTAAPCCRRKKHVIDVR